MHPGTMTSKLPIEEDLEFERTESRVAHVLWFALLALMAATLLGLFGNGPLSAAQAGDEATGLRIEYERFGRLGAAMRTTVQLRPPVNGHASFTLTRPYLDAVRIVGINPEPDSAEPTASEVRYEFTRLTAPATITIDFEPRTFGRIRGRIGTDAGHQEIAHLIYP